MTREVRFYMSLEVDVMFAVRKFCDDLKMRLDNNLSRAVDMKMISIEREKVPGLAKIFSDTVDQSLVEDTTVVQNVCQRHSK
tara:strand:- start:465 stop:710 length:246 start_codon:yes stop_codon:yes gene_type:complete